MTLKFNFKTFGLGAAMATIAVFSTATHAQAGRPIGSSSWSVGESTTSTPTRKDAPTLVDRFLTMIGFNETAPDHDRLRAMNLNAVAAKGGDRCPKSDESPEDESETETAAVSPEPVLLAF